MATDGSEQTDTRSFLSEVQLGGLNLELLSTAGPVFALETLMFVVPLLIMFGIGFMEMVNFQLVSKFTVQHYVDVFTYYPNQVAIYNTLTTAVLVTLATIIIAYPIAYWIARRGGSHKNQLVMLLIVPFWTNYVIRTYGWSIVLSKQGPFNQLLQFIGVINDPIGWWLSTKFAIWLGLTYLWLPFMILPLYAALESIDQSLIEAAYDLGASRYAVFRRVILPLSMPGLTAGIIFVFIFSVGAFIVPNILGGGIPFLGSRISFAFGSGGNWPAGAALSSVVMIFVAIVLGILMRYADMEAIA
ncbi:spermidine Putrescine ABC transporter permease component PotB [Halarchaeum acidiphilum MH1-52-1]|uniref:Spermidine Putrescine ABC transporter permease component PotB n=1 Tax=Halarchaeum acidiphilum MH1-52-1 TaxID=1261545 RepID=U2YS89_9EURY|nr:ABC transporter permease [Halarchaeum acidiphilum]GAD51850.1 spermidine Putrescine ABC transporter permease component PotB [Halarchaeum acidiphilum MH1-52-1]